MRRIQGLVASAVLCLWATAALADPAPATSGAQGGAATTTATGAGAAAAPTTVPPPKADSEMDKVTCRTELPVGSRLGGHRVCLSRRDWIQRTKDAQDELSGSVRRSDQNAMKGGN